jgi:ankyrin repeat protein
LLNDTLGTGMLNRLEDLIDNDAVATISDKDLKSISNEDFGKVSLYALSKGKAKYIYLLVVRQALALKESEFDRHVMTSICENDLYRHVMTSIYENDLDRHVMTSICENDLGALVHCLSNKDLNDATKVMSLSYLLASDRFEGVREFLTSKGGEKVRDSAFVAAAAIGDVKSMSSVLQLDIDVNVRDLYGRVALIVAAMEGHVEVVETLLAHGANINLKDSDGNTALIVAAREGHVKVVKTLLAHGANINDVGWHGRVVALFVAAMEGHEEVVETLLAHGANINLSDPYGDTALIIAAREGHVKVVETLLANGADVAESNLYYYTALIFAAREGHVKVVETLLAHGADMNEKDCGNYTVLMNAAGEGHEEIVKLLIRRGVDPNIKNEDGKTALDVASSDDMKNIIREEWVRTKLAAVTGPILGSIAVVGCASTAYALSAYGVLAFPVVNLLLAGAAIGGMLTFFLKKTCSQGVENIAYEFYTWAGMTRYNLDASSEASPAV